MHVAPLSGGAAARIIHARYIPRMSESAKTDRERDREFGRWLFAELERRGYDMSRKGGGRTKFAADSGVSPSTIARAVRGDGIRDVPILTLIAEALGIRVSTILVRAGVLTEEDLHGVNHPERRRPITPEEAARELGISEPSAVEAFVAMTRALRDRSSADDQPRSAEP